MRLIDGDALVESIKEELWHWDTVDGINATTVLKQTISDINNMPTIEQPEIIRCRECKEWEMYGNGCQGWCGKLGLISYDDDYCGWAERREVSE